MSLSAKHPSRAEIDPDWELMRHAYAGERKIKEFGTKYLPETSGMRADGMQEGQEGYAQYRAYITRAVYHDVVRPALEGLLGIMHNKPAVIELTPRLERLRNKATSQGENLQALLRRMNEQQLLMGRIGLMMDVPSGQPVNSVMPYLTTYDAERILNWDVTMPDFGDQKLSLVVLDESTNRRTSGFLFERKNRYRVLATGATIKSLSPAFDATELSDDEYYAAVVENDDVALAVWVKPSIGGTSLKELPFSFVGSKDLVPDPDYPPLLPLARLSLAMYRGEADYRQALFMQAQETLVLIGATYGEEDKLKVGAGAQIDVPLGGDAKYIGVSADGLGEMRQGLQNDKANAMEYGARMLDNRGKEAESGDALRVRVASKTATLSTVVDTAGEALLQTLRRAAEWVGDDPDKITVQVNKDFSDVRMAPRDILELQQAKMLGAPISQKSIHKVLRDKSFTDMSYDDELSEIEDEEPLNLTGTAGVSDPLANDDANPGANQNDDNRLPPGDNGG